MWRKLTDIYIIPLILITNAQDYTTHSNIDLLPMETCGYYDHGGVIRGNLTELFEFPWMALLVYSNVKNETKFLCGGTVINKNYILTAAHCVKPMSDYILTSIRLGEHDISTDPDCEGGADGIICAESIKEFPIKQIISHPEFDTINKQNNIALLRLANKITMSDSIMPICLPITEYLQKLKLFNGVVTSWGLTKNNTQSNELLKVTMPIKEIQECQTLYKSYKLPIGESQICIDGSWKEGPCGGDGGCPLHYIAAYKNQRRYVQFGIVSYGPHYCTPGGPPDVLTNVARYMKWILDNIEK